MADLRNFQSWNKILPSQDLSLVNGSSVMLLLRVDTPMEGFSTPKECRSKSVDFCLPFVLCIFSS